MRESDRRSWEQLHFVGMRSSSLAASPSKVDVSSVALDRGSVPEVVMDGVTGFVRDDPADLPAAINDAGCLDPAACRHVEERFDISIMAAGYERAYARASRGQKGTDKAR